MDFLSNFREEFLYNFINYSFDNNTLKLRPVYINGKLLNQKSKFVKVSDMRRIRNTRFPDIDEIMVKFDLKGKRPAEIKFRTSQFAYHSDKKYKEQYNEFKIKNGCIIVAKHDYLPIGLEDDVIDVFELNFEELRLYGKYNYDKLLNLQVREHSIQKIWLMETSKNFYEGADGVKPAIESHIWCPTEQLTSLDFDVNDIVIFIKTKGASKQKVQKIYIPENWVLDELFIARVKKPIMNRKEYCQINNISYMTPLWYDETLEGYSNSRVKKRKNNPTKGEWRWKRVFEFMPLYYYNNLNIKISDLLIINRDFCEALKRTYGVGYSTEISKQIYEKTILDILKITNTREYIRPF